MDVKVLAEKLKEALEALLEEFKEWEEGRSTTEPTIIRIHDKLIEDDPTSERGVINLGTVPLAIYSAIEDLNRNHDAARAMAVLLYRLVVSHPFVDGNKRASLAFVFSILYGLGVVNVPERVEKELLKNLAELSDNPPEEDENAISRIQAIMRLILEG